MLATKITLFLPSGDSQGFRTAQIGSWSGLALACPRSKIEELLAREEIDKAGIYFLTGRANGYAKPAAYIGEAEDVGKRLRNHRDKDFWVQAIVFVGKDDLWTKSHFRFVEGELIEEAKEVGTFTLVNDKPSGAKLSEADRVEMQDFMARIRQLLPILGCNLLVPLEHPQPEQSLICKIKGLSARGQRTANGFVVYKGSQAVGTLRNATQTRGGWIIKIRNRLLESKILVEEGDHLVFAKDNEFDSPSAAAAIIRGGNANGLTEWRNSDGKNLKQLEGAT